LNISLEFLEKNKILFIIYWLNKSNFFISFKSAKFCISSLFEGIASVFGSKIALTVILFKVAEPIEADNVNEKNKYWALISSLRKYSIQ
jgi:hypothetical protein